MSGVSGVGVGHAAIGSLDVVAPPPRGGARLGATADRMPPPSGGTVPSGAVPILSMPQSFDASELMSNYLALKTKMGDAELGAAMKDVEATGKAKKDKNVEVSAKIAEAAAKQAEAAKTSWIAKIFGWIALAFTVIASIAVAVASFGTLTGVMALATAAVAITMATLNETGVMEKMTEAIKDSLMKGGMSEEDASKWAMGLTIGIQLGVSLATIVGGAAASAQAATSIASGVVKVTTKIAELAATVDKIARASAAVVTIVQQGVAIGSAVKTKEAADATADSMELKKFLAKLKAAQDDEMDRIQQMMQQAQATVSTAIRILSGQTESSSNIIRHMG